MRIILIMTDLPVWVTSGPTFTGADRVVSLEGAANVGKYRLLAFVVHAGEQGQLSAVRAHFVRLRRQPRAVPACWLRSRVLSLLVWSARVSGALMGVDGVSEDHVLASSGPYRYVRHPVYGSFTLIAVGPALVFRSPLLAVVAAVWLVASSRWAAAEETLLASSEGLGDVYGTYRTDGPVPAEAEAVRR
jgi:protein-S-isoprenylcysteine O-methyltransferase Ste14